MSNIDTINVGGLDYSVEDSEARDMATGAVNVSAYVENGNTASRAYPTIGTPINWKGSLYYTKATITAGSTLSTATNLTAAANLGAMIRNIKTYVGTDSKLHFTDATGADSVLPFSNTLSNYSQLASKSGAGTSLSLSASSITVGDTILVESVAPLNTSNITTVSGATQKFKINVGTTSLAFCIATSTTVSATASFPNSGEYTNTMRIFKLIYS